MARTQTVQFQPGFSDLISSGNTGLQSQLDWSNTAYPNMFRTDGVNRGQVFWDNARDIFTSYSDAFGDKALEPIVFQGNLMSTDTRSGGRAFGSASRFKTYQHHPYGMVPLGPTAESEQFRGGPTGVGGGGLSSGMPMSSMRYLDPSTGETFSVIRRGDIGYVYDRSTGDSVLATGDGGTTTTVGDATTDTTTGETTVGDTTITDTTGGTATEVTTTGDTPVTDVTTTDDSGVGLTGTTGTGTSDMPLTYQNLLGGWGMNQGGGYSYNPGFNLPQAQYPVPGDRPTFSDYTNDQIIRSLRAEHNWSVPGVTEGTFREREGWDVKSDQDILDFMAGKSASWLQGQQKEFRPAALAQMGEDIGQRNEFQQRTQAADILNMANQGFLGSMGMMQDYGRGAMQEVGKNYLRNVGRGRAGLASRGMTGTTVYDAMMRGAGEQSMQDYLTTQDAITGRKIQTYQQGIGGIVNALNSIQYRTMHPMEYANLYQAFGEGGAGADVPEAPSTTTNALLGTALGVATPLLLNSIFGPVGAVAGGVLGSAAAAGGNILGGIGDFLEDTWDTITDWF
mgnify:CR=1 FL=1